ncbi:MAG: hypothetical protein P4M11_08270 [Candidatus Pacebacteria bacterium]|nr:hypothetical protein [Candidatus Paceibacterota bacterium]
MLTPTHMFSFKECKKYSSPTECIEIAACKTIRSAEEEINRKFSFVSLLHSSESNRASRPSIAPSIFRPRATPKRRAGSGR